MSNLRPAPIALALALAAAPLIGACKTDSREESPNQTAHATDSNTAQTSFTPPTTGAEGVTKTDARSVWAASEYELTADNFSKFVRANESLAALRQRDPQARAFLDQDAAEGGSPDIDAGVKRLLSQPAVRTAIENAGISVPDYYVSSIAVASARKFVADPKAAPPTPATRRNAEFLRGHQAELQRLDQLAQQRATTANSR